MKKEIRTVLIEQNLNEAKLQVAVIPVGALRLSLYVVEHNCLENIILMVSWFFAFDFEMF